MHICSQWVFAVILTDACSIWSFRIVLVHRRVFASMVKREHGSSFELEAVAAPATVSGEQFSANATGGPTLGPLGRLEKGV